MEFKTRKSIDKRIERLVQRRKKLSNKISTEIKNLKIMRAKFLPITKTLVTAKTQFVFPHSQPIRAICPWVPMDIDERLDEREIVDAALLSYIIGRIQPETELKCTYGFYVPKKGEPRMVGNKLIFHYKKAADNKTDIQRIKRFVRQEVKKVGKIIGVKIPPPSFKFNERKWGSYSKRINLFS